MTFETNIRKFQEAFNQGLPGLEAQMLMAPLAGRGDMTTNKLTRESGVLLLLYPGHNTMNTVLILRPDYDGVHGGQIGLPGGKKEVGDKNIEETALREANEELGINRNEVEIIGSMTQLFIPPSNSLVTPVVGFVNDPPPFIPDKREVAEVIETGVFELIDQRNQDNTSIHTKRGTLKNVPCYTIEQHIIWGATAMMLSEFGEILKKVQD